MSAIGAGESATPAGALGELAQWCSLRERESVEIERAADDVARSFLLEREDRERTWDGEVVGLIGGGAFVAFGDGFQGLLPARRLRGEHGGHGAQWWELNEEGTILMGSRAGATIRLGDPLRVRVHTIDAVRGRVDLDVAEASRR